MFIIFQPINADGSASGGYQLAEYHYTIRVESKICKAKHKKLFENQRTEPL